MAILSKLMVMIGADASGLQKELERSARSARRMADEFASIGNTLSLSITAPVTLLAGAALKATADLDSLRRGMVAVMGSAEAAAKNIERLREVAKLPGLGFREAVQGSINLQAAGFSAEVAERALKAFGNALATVGKGKTELDGVIVALSQIASKGQVSAEEINQLAERLPQIRVAMKEAFGTADTKQLQEMGIGAQEFVEAIIAQFERLPKATGGLKTDFENLRDTIDQALDQIGAKMAPTATKVINDFLVPAANKTIELVDAFTRLPEPIQNATFALGFLAIIVGPIAKLIEALLSLKGVALTIGKYAAPLLAFALRAIPFVAIATAAYFLYDALRKQKDMIESNAEAVRRLNEKYRDSILAQMNYGNVVTQTNNEIVNRAMATVDGMDEAMAAVRRSNESLEENAQVVEKVRVHYDNLKETLDRIEQSKAGQRLIEDWTRVLELAEQARAGLPPALLELPERDLSRPTVETHPGDVLRVPIELPKDVPPITELPVDLERANERLRKTGELLGVIGKKGKEVQGPWRTFGQQVSTILTDMSRGIADVIFEGGKLGDVFKGVAVEIGKAFTRFVIEQGINAAMKALGGLLNQLGSVGKAVGNILGTTGSSAASGAGGGFGSVAGGGGGGIFGAIGSVVGAVSGIIGNFQMRGANKALDRIVLHTLQTANQLIYGLQPQINAYLPALGAIHDRLVEIINNHLWKLHDIHDRLVEIINNHLWSGMAGGQMTVVVNIDGKQVAAQVVRQLKAAGAQ